MFSPVLWSSRVLEKDFSALLVKVPFARPSYCRRCLLDFGRNIHLVLPQTSVTIMFGATTGHENAQREIGSCLGAHFQPCVVSPVLPLIEMEKKPDGVLSRLAAVIVSFLEYMNSLPSTLPQRPCLPNTVFLSLPSMLSRLSTFSLQTRCLAQVSCSSRDLAKAESNKKVTARSGTSPVSNLPRAFPQKAERCGLH